MHNTENNLNECLSILTTATSGNHYLQHLFTVLSQQEFTWVMQVYLQIILIYVI